MRKIRGARNAECFLACFLVEACCRDQIQLFLPFSPRAWEHTSPSFTGVWKPRLFTVSPFGGWLGATDRLALLCGRKKTALAARPRKGDSSQYKLLRGDANLGWVPDSLQSVPSPRGV